MKPEQIREALAQCVRDLEDGLKGPKLTSVAFAKDAIKFLDSQQADHDLTPEGKSTAIHLAETILDHRNNPGACAPYLAYLASVVVNSKS